MNETELEFAKNYWVSYKGKKNVKWEIRWDPSNNIFAFFLYVREEKGIRVYRELIPSDILKGAIGDPRRINDVVETCVDKLSKLNGVKLKDY